MGNEDGNDTDDTAELIAVARKRKMAKHSNKKNNVLEENKTLPEEIETYEQQQEQQQEQEEEQERNIRLHQEEERKIRLQQQEQQKHQQQKELQQQQQQQ